MYLGLGLKRAHSAIHILERKMKKAFVILTIMILVACSVFATESATIRVTTKVDSKTPTFVLKAGLTPDSFDKAISDDEADNVLGWETVEKSIKAEDIVVFFEIIQKGDSRAIGEKYSLNIEASEMILILNEDGSQLASNTDIYKTTKGKVSNPTGIGNEKAIVEVTNVKSTSKDVATIVTEYTGTVTDGTPIAKFTVTWAKDNNAPDGIYQASVVLKVSKQ